MRGGKREGVRGFAIAVVAVGSLIMAGPALAQETTQGDDAGGGWPPWATTIVSIVGGLGSGYASGRYAADKSSRTEMAKLSIEDEVTNFDEALSAVREFAESFVRTITTPKDATEFPVAMGQLYGRGLELQRRCQVLEDLRIADRAQNLRGLASKILEQSHGTLKPDNEATQGTSKPGVNTFPGPPSLELFEKELNALVSELGSARRMRIEQAKRAA